MIELEEEEYVSVLHRADGAKNRPRALLFTDAADKERGVLFLGEFFNLDLDTEQTATLAMDFGTSNTCLAVNAGSKSETLAFTLSPLQLWGTPPLKLRDNPGFVPRDWAKKDFSRRFCFRVNRTIICRLSNRINFCSNIFSKPIFRVCTKE